MPKIPSFVHVVLALAVVTACSNPAPAPGTDSGAMTADTGGGGTDTGPRADTGPGRDGGPGVDTAVDAAGSTSCTAPIDLNAMGTALATGTGRTIASSNVSAAAGPLAEVASACADDGMGGSVATNEVVFRYTVETGGHLVASTDDPASSPDLDTIVWILDACAASATELACNDDGPNNLLSVAMADATVTAGTTVFIVVAGYAGADVSTGSFTLSVTELQPHAANEACDATNFYCVDGYTCLRDGPGATTGHCRQDGGDNGLCRVTAPFCDTGLECSEDAPTVDNTGVCQVPIASGDVCTDIHYVCVAGSTCQMDEGSTTMGHCLADGAEFGACRTTGMACDTGLACSAAMPTAGATGTCQTPIVGAGACTQRHSVCVTGFSCQLDQGSETAGHCLADGAEYGLCHLTAPLCETGLTCTSATPMAGDGETCQMPIASGAACTAWHYLCVTGSHCIPDAGSSTMGHCLLDGAMGAACRETPPECDGTLTCDPFSGTCG